MVRCTRCGAVYTIITGQLVACPKCAWRKNEPAGYGNPGLPSFVDKDKKDGTEFDVEVVEVKETPKEKPKEKAKEEPKAPRGEVQ
jgi:predicted  nucleic acid-binding Zn-ribbon protein